MPVRVALTKCDKLKPMRRAQRVRVLKQETGLAKSHVIASCRVNDVGANGFGLPLDFERPGLSVRASG